MDRRNNEEYNIRNDDGMIEGRQIPNEMDNYEDMVRTREQENITGEDVKKLMTQYVRAYDPRHDQDGNLISNKQTVVQSKKDEMFKNKNISNETEVANRNTFTEKGFDRQTLTTTVIGGSKRTVKRKPKFLYVSLAMMASKGANTID